MPKGIFLIKFSVIEGGTILMRYPEDLEIPENVVQQIQISHNFTESYIISEEKDWNSISFYNEDKDLVIVLVLNKYDDGNDFIPVLEEFNREIEDHVEGKELKDALEKMYNFSLNVFRTRDEVISKLSNEVASLKTQHYDYEKKFEKIIESDYLTVKGKVQFLLTLNNSLTLEELRNEIDTSKRWLEEVLQTLEKNGIIGYNSKKNTYYLNF
jgi:hypothetical protein